MPSYSTSEAARKIGLHPASLARYIAVGKIPLPKVVITGRTKTHIWSEADIERVRKLLPKIANGRKTRYQKKKDSVVRTQKSGKTTRKTKKKKRS